MSPSRSIRATDPSSDGVQRAAFAAHETLGRDVRVEGTLRRIVRESWRRSLVHLPHPSTAQASIFCSEAELEGYRRSHPLAVVMPVLERLLVRPSLDAGMLVAVGDARGRLLWVDGDRMLRRRAEGMLFMAGADWSEASVGTSAPGTALALRQSVQIAGAEHFSPQAHPWSCTAVPVRDPDSGAVLGVVDITGSAEAATAFTLSLVEAAVAAAEAHLMVHRLRRRDDGVRVPRSPGRATAPPPRNSLRILGTEHGILQSGGTSLELSLRHTELLTALALHPEGLSADRLVTMVYPEGAPETTVRAEMLRLRRILGRRAPSIVPGSRPYRLPTELDVDATQVLLHLHRGAHRRALALYRGPVLARSQAPVIIRLRCDTSTLLREAVLGDGASDTVLRYLALPEAEYDVEAWQLALRVLPARSPRRAAIVAHVEWLEAELAGRNS